MTNETSMEFFFAFPDGVFHYVCAECDALCCKGQGFGGNLKREMSFLLERYPSLGVVTTSRQHSYIDVATPRGQCYFLQSGNLCQIEVEHGRGRKPGICVAFPFNRFQRIGNVVAVMPHFLCPLRVEVPAKPGDVLGTHSQIEEDLRESQILDPGYVTWEMKPHRLPASENAESVLAREKLFRDVTADSIGRECFRNVVRGCSEDPAALLTLVHRVEQLMFWQRPADTARDEMDGILLAIASPLRMEFLHFSSEEILRALALAETLVRCAWSCSNNAPSPQAVYSIIQKSMPVLRLLCRGDGMVRLSAEADVPEFCDPELTLAACDALRDLETTMVLDTLERAAKHLFTASERSILAHCIGEHVLDP